MTVNQNWHGSFQFALGKSGQKRTSVNDMKRTYGLDTRKLNNVRNVINKHFTTQHE